MVPRLLVAGLGLTCFTQLLLAASAANAWARHGGMALSSSQRSLRNGRADADSSAGEMNFCMEGRLTPTFFVLGTMKAGTTFFINEFVRSPGVVNYKPADDEPEWHTREPWVFIKDWSDNSTALWLSHYPECSHTQRLVAADFTPGYFSSGKAPFMLKRAYGNNKPLVFMIFLREPMKRSLWHYRHIQNAGVLEGRVPNCPADKFPPTFMKAVRQQIAHDTICECECDNIFKHSMYVDSFKRYFKNFQTDRFHVVPYKSSVKQEVVRFAWDLMKLPHVESTSSQVDLQPPEDKALPSLGEELPGRLKFRFKRYMLDRASAWEVAKVLADSKCNLYGFGGDDQRTVVRVSQWLDTEWDA